MDDLKFWKRCCERGLSICPAPKPFKEEVTCWLVQKTTTLVDPKTWNASHTFDSDDEMFAAVEQYLATGLEPRSGATTASPPAWRRADPRA